MNRCYSRFAVYLPDLGAIDISPIILFLAAQFLRNLLYSFTVRLELSGHPIISGVRANQSQDNM